MPPLRLGPNNFLEYDSRYGVLICRECQYAIQKSALQSHLLRHKIYREQRQRLLSSIAQLNLFEPDEVPLPARGSPPIDGLPIISGYCCTAVNCGNLCASTKRMRRHRSEVHGHSETEVFSEIARPANLQTFFRGTKIRYFEVTPSAAEGTAGAVNEQLQRRPSPAHHSPTPLETPSKAFPLGIDLEILTYFHHFTATTSLTLPCADFAQNALHGWQTDVVLLALQRRWLMCGLLAISAIHLAMLTTDTDIERVHRERSAQLFSEFVAGWEMSAEMDENVVMAAVQLRRILRCTRDFIIPELVLSPNGMLDDNAYTLEETFSHASRILSATSLSDAGNFGASFPGDPMLSATLSRLDALPSRMTEALGRPESTGNVFIVLSAIATLVESCSGSFASDDPGMAWRAMASWLTKVPNHFHSMVSRRDPSALVVLAHWAATLIKRAENCGCWFLRGSTEAVLRFVEQRLPRDDREIPSLIEGLE
ncbi:hypothetical protein K458DRAFT_291114 [Lentithecium fluviatile CBS 122367]|uniref:C2H2-type domain-containing protein n=1 Tax=Lentithecium fluviatile CBS 122367 TaxID=1168545 RepID=A0A6G1JH30_9PLEO|nr:hypothetical protein K458DRAFT_291114 [Lentithecium fluviatile CBS 122367]